MRISNKALAQTTFRIGLMCGVLMVPAHYGYSSSKTTGGRPTATEVVAKSSVSAGIVTEVTGSAYLVDESKPEPVKLNAQYGILLQSKIWVEPKSKLFVTNIAGGEVSVAGPAVVVFSAPDTVTVLSGSVKLHSYDGTTQYFKSKFMDGYAATRGGLAGVVVNPKNTRVVGLAGDVRAWHPKLQEAVITVEVGKMAESSPKNRFLQPRKPTDVSDDEIKSFMMAFVRDGEDDSYRVDRPKQKFARPARAVASAPAEHPQSAESADAAPVVRKGPSKAALEMLMQAKISGADTEELIDRLPSSAEDENQGYNKGKKLKAVTPADIDKLRRQMPRK